MRAGKVAKLVSQWYDWLTCMEPWAPSTAPHKLGLVVLDKWRQEDQKFKVKSKT